MEPRTAKTVPIARRAQVQALASPLRQDLLDVLETAGPLSIAELASRVGRPADSLYFHVRELLRVGLVVECERRKVGRHAYVVYDVIGRPLRIDRAKARPAELSAVMTGILRLAARDYGRGLGDGRGVGDGPARNHWGARVRGWLDARDLTRVNALLEEASALIRRGRPEAGRTPIAMTWVIAPVPPRRRGGAASPARKTRHRTGTERAPSAAGRRKSRTKGRTVS